jgi:hypothetical protein
MFLFGWLVGWLVSLSSVPSFAYVCVCVCFNARTRVRGAGLAYGITTSYRLDGPRFEFR